ncbi:uncharacterized protein L201_007960 [Kwoniella dendrophila CBS 6074]|uniref:SAGA-associated factor 11 n=1 Tax=Kwoniella dendrophila CBS 6074 TaxID=1295534 RepID=A0AAX4K5K9_9TREE
MDRKTEISIASNAILDEMINDLILSTAMSAHREIKRGRVVCGTCGTKCRSHAPLPLSSHASSSSSSLNANQSAPPSRGPSPQPSIDGLPAIRTGGYMVGPEKGTGGSTGIGSGSGRIDSNGNTFFECLVCGRSVASNRYAPHLSSCLGLNGSTRRGAARSATNRARLGNNDRSSPSPYVMGSSKNGGDGGSENGDWERGSDGDSVNGKKKKKLITGVSSSASITASAKRNKSPIKGSSIPKKPKIGPGSTTNSGSATPTPSFKQALPPSKLGRPPTNRPIDISRTPSSSPEKSVISISSSGGGGGGTTGRKTLPGQGQDPNYGGIGSGENASAAAGGDESSDGEVDDY